MKTLREILLERHRAKEPDLDALRQRILQKSPCKTEAAFGCRCRIWLKALKAEVVMPYQRAWATLATAWIMILVLNALSAEEDLTITQGEHGPPAEIRTAFAERQKLARELGFVFALDESSEETSPSKPRSQQKSIIRKA